MRPCAPSASARKTRRWHGPDSGDATTRLCTEHLTEQEFRGRPAGNVACAAFAGGPFRTVAVPRAGGSGGNRVRGMEGLALDLVTCRPRDFGHARQPPWASFSSDGRSGGLGDVEVSSCFRRSHSHRLSLSARGHVHVRARPDAIRPGLTWFPVSLTQLSPGRAGSASVLPVVS